MKKIAFSVDCKITPLPKNDGEFCQIILYPIFISGYTPEGCVRKKHGEQTQTYGDEEIKFFTRDGIFVAIVIAAHLLKKDANFIIDKITDFLEMEIPLQIAIFQMSE